MPEGYSWLNTEALEIRSKADRADLYVTQLHVGPSAEVVEPGPDDVLSRAPEGCIAIHVLSVSMGLRFPLHPFLREYLRFVGLVPFQLTPNSHSYIAGFLQLYKSRGVKPSLDLFFQSFNLCRGGGGGGARKRRGIRKPAADCPLQTVLRCSFFQQRMEGTLVLCKVGREPIPEGAARSILKARKDQECCPRERRPKAGQVPGGEK
ncbi:unnamed protein product [Cuscuta europaea]|uniref:Transposase (putative) gypsy type domain-containing protein n=1 Tax=Cuscuta europaea TaxID=41803 RepID=A0A9P0ZGH5_CUSEU|nr:unnamed protein product [Cuscuta europaea]